MEHQVLYALWSEGEESQGTTETQTSGQVAPTGPLQGCGQMGGMLVPLLFMFVIIYFLIMRPQQKQQKKHKEMLGALKKGDRVITNSGILGTIMGITDVTITLEVSKNIHFKILRSHVAGLQPESLEKAPATPVLPDEKRLG